MTMFEFTLVFVLVVYYFVSSSKRDKRDRYVDETLLLQAEANYKNRALINELRGEFRYGLRRVESLELEIAGLRKDVYRLEYHLEKLLKDDNDDDDVWILPYLQLLKWGHELRQTSFAPARASLPTDRIYYLLRQ